jgi:hypothetical protein
MAGELSNYETTDVCDVFLLSHAHNITFVDCLRRILLLRQGGVRGGEQRVVKVFLDQHIAEGDADCRLMEREARNCRIGGRNIPLLRLLPIRQIGCIHTMLHAH